MTTETQSPLLHHRIIANAAKQTSLTVLQLRALVSCGKLPPLQRLRSHTTINLEAINQWIAENPSVYMKMTKNVTASAKHSAMYDYLFDQNRRDKYDTKVVDDAADYAAAEELKMEEFWKDKRK